MKKVMLLAGLVAASPVLAQDPPAQNETKRADRNSVKQSRGGSARPSKKTPWKKGKVSNGGKALKGGKIGANRKARGETKGE